jgi:phosphoglycolate phosphatase
MHPEILLWDWDNTLVDAWISVAHALNAVFTRFNMPVWSVQETRARVRGSLRDTFPDMFGSAWPDARDIFYTALSRDHLQHLTPMPGAEAALAELSGWPQGVVSNKDGRFLRAEVAHLGWSDRFGPVIGAGDAAEDKPSAAPILMALGRMGVSPSKSVWYCGDTALDMQAARAAGCTAVLIGDATHDGGIFHAEPDHCFANLAAFTLHLRRLAPDRSVAT